MNKYLLNLIMIAVLLITNGAIAHTIIKTGSGPPTWTYTADAQGLGFYNRIEIVSETNLQALGASANTINGWTGTISGNSAIWTHAGTAADQSGLTITCNVCSDGDGTWSISGGVPANGSLDDVPLPVHLVGFSGLWKEKSVELYWNTASETDNAGYIVETIYDRYWEEVANPSTEAALEAKPNQNSPQYYSWTDKNPPKNRETVSYRLSSLSLSGEREVIEILTIETKVGAINHAGVGSVRFSRIQLQPAFPNPFNPSTNLRFTVSGNLGQVEYDANLTVYNIRGEVVKTVLRKKLTSGQYTYQWDATDNRGAAVSTGIYFAVLKVIQNGKQYRSKQKLLLMH